MEANNQFAIGNQPVSVMSATWKCLVDDLHQLGPVRSEAAWVKVKF